MGSRRLRSLLTLFGIALGVGVLFASLATDAGIETSIDRTVRDIVGRADLRISAFRERGLADATVEAIQNTPGVAVVAPAVERRTYLGVSPRSGTATLPPPVTVLGIDPATDGRIRDLDLVAGSPLERPDELAALVTERLARDDGLALGQDLTILGGALAGPVHVRVVGILAGDGPVVGAAGRAVIVPIHLARETFELDGVNRVDIRIAEGADIATVVAALDERLTAEPYVLSKPRDVAASLRASTADFRATSALVAAVALFVGAFLIFNTLSMTVTERMREVGLLRAAGTTRRQVVGLILIEAAALGTAGSLLGLVIGLALAAGMTAWVRTVAVVPLDGLVVSLKGVALAVGVGIAVTLAAALEPAIRASRITPVEALKSRIEPGGRVARLRWLVIVFVVVGVIGLLAWPAGTGDAGALRSLAVYGLLLLVTLASPFILGPLGRLAGIPFAPLFRLEERLTRGALVRDRSRTVLTVGALTIGLAMIVAVGTVAQSARRAATAWLDGVVPGDEIVTSIRPVGLDEGIGEELASIDGVERVTPVASFDVAYRGQRLDAAAIVGGDVLVDGRLTFVEGDRTAALSAIDEGGVVILPRAVADRLGLRAGGVMTFPVGSGRTADLRVAAVVDRGLPGRAGETIFLGWDDATEIFGVAGVDFFAVRFEPGRIADARPALEALARGYALEPTPLPEVQGAISDALGRVFGLFDALAVAAVVVAALGIVNTLTMNVRERVREIGVLRATGMTRPQVRRMVVVEAGILGVVGVVIGGLTGLVAGSVMTVLASGGLATALGVPWDTLGLAAALGVAVSMLAAFYPARLASRMSIIRAVQYE